jgi:hypothetical protein
MHAEFAQAELTRARESIATLEERRNQSFTEELTAAKAVARLEADLRAKDRAVTRLEVALTASTVREAAAAAIHATERMEGAGHVRETMLGTALATLVIAVLVGTVATMRRP